MTQKFFNGSAEREQAYANLLANLPGMVYRCLNTPDFPMNFVSDGCYDLTGYAASELTGESRVAYGDLIHHDDRQTVWQTIQLAMQNQQPFIMEYRIFRKDGQLRWVWEKGRAAVSEDSKEVLDGIILDITSRRQAEEENRKAQEELAASEEKFRLLAELAPAGVVISDINENILYINRRFTDLFGYTIAEIPSEKEWWALAYPDPATRKKIRTDWIELVQEARQNKNHVVTYEALVKCKDGSERQIDFRVSSSGELNFVLLTDITDRCKLEKQLRMAHKMDSVGRLAGGIAHDFNNMLGVIIGYSDMAIDMAKGDNELSAALHEILTAGMKSRDITRKLLSFARKQYIKPVVVNLNQLVEGMLSMLRRLVGENIELRWLPDSKLWHTRLDPAQLDEILTNLCMNSRDAIAGNGKIIIETANYTLDDAYCRDNKGWLPGEYAMLAISDDGRGIDRDALDNIFEPFFTIGQGSGRGMGLPTIYGMVKQNNGFIDIKSEPGYGTSVRIFLPHASEDSLSKPELPDSLIKGNNELVLLVEDEPALLQATRIMLEKLGYRVITAGTSREAVEIAENRQGSIQLLITDVAMPAMNGYELALRLKACQPGIAALFISGYTASQIDNQNLFDYEQTFLQKPFSIVELSQKVNQILSSRKS
ncbi:MAG: hybrid sensor histidine kinase/response regulator [Candidatus Riflebacteria bacterium HGW-Riflebacteria-2]|nr:MAG: hybrid sensor histidine kinase/response regulator [Candidatus Riflebacteria bacterium HGW-Riflebacteria-2]